MERIVTYRAVAWSFFRVGAGAFGGGWASLPVFAAELAGRRGWFEEGELAEMFALAQSVPGVILVNFAVLAGENIDVFRNLKCGCEGERKGGAGEGGRVRPGGRR